MKRLTACLLMVVLTCLPVSLAVAQEDPAPLQMPGRLEASTGTLFEVTDSEYFNVTVQSSEPITLMLESMPEMITMHLEPASGATSTEIRLSGLVPWTTYHKYEDDYHNHVAFTTDASGSYAYTQDLSQPHFVFIQPRMSTKYIRDDATGGDCILIGTWDAATKTCTLTSDVGETIQIDSNGITLDGNGHTVTGTGTGFGVYLSGRTGVTIKDLAVKQFSYGIGFSSSSGNTLTGNTADSNTGYGISLYFSSGNTLTNNNANSNTPSHGSGSGQGILLYSSSNNTITNNNANSNYGGGIVVYYLSDGNTLISNTANSNGSGIVVGQSSGNTITNNNANSNGYGIFLYYHGIPSGNTITNNNANSNYYGIVLTFTSNNTITKNNVNSNYEGIFLAFSTGNTLTNNNVSSNGLGIHLDYRNNNNKIYNNNFINNSMQAWEDSYQNIGNVFNLAAPIGGNYWSNYDTPAEGCNNVNGDSFCDAPYRFSYGQDNLPWTRQSGWEVPADTTPPVIVATVTPAANAAGWNNSNVTVTWNVTDAESGIASSSGCGTTTVTAETPGTTLPCSATNGAGLSSSASVEVKVDKTPPTVTYSGNAGTYTIDQSVAITCTAADALSGVASDTCANINGPAYTFALGTNTFSASATDLAGNTGSGSTSFTVEVTAAGLGNLVTQFVTNAGVANSMISKLNAAAAAAARGNAQAKAGAIGAFINEIQAQSGKALTAAQAATLITLGQAL